MVSNNVTDNKQVSRQLNIMVPFHTDDTVYKQSSKWIIISLIDNENTLIWGMLFAGRQIHAGR